VFCIDISSPNDSPVCGRGKNILTFFTKGFIIKMLKREHINAIEKVLKKGDRIEIIPVKDGIRIVKVKRENIPLSKS
jgi:hypothetical protein